MFETMGIEVQMAVGAIRRFVSAPDTTSASPSWRGHHSWLLLLALAATATATASAAAVPPAAATVPVSRFDPLRFFTGRTHGEGVIRVVFGRARGIHIDGEGLRAADGSLALVQRIDEDGKPPRTRDWTLRRAGSDGYAATLSDAIGPVRVEATPSGLHIRFRAKGGLRIEQWLASQPGDRVVRNRLVVHAHGLRVAVLDEVIRKYD